MRMALAIEPNSARIHNNLGALFFFMGDLKAGLKEFETAVRINPSYYLAFRNMGDTYAQLGELEKAVQNYEQALALRPHFNGTHAEAHAELAKVLNRQGQAEQAEAHLRKAMELNPNLPFCVLNNCM
jgi:protein O-GlcNAc transferase